MEVIYITSKTTKFSLFSSCSSSLGNSACQSGRHLRYCNSLEYSPSTESLLKVKGRTSAGKKAKRRVISEHLITSLKLQSHLRLQRFMYLYSQRHGERNLRVHVFVPQRILHLKFAMICIPQLHTAFP